MFTDFMSSTCFFIKQKMTVSKKKSKLNTSLFYHKVNAINA